jgi:putative hemolysin
MAGTATTSQAMTASALLALHSAPQTAGPLHLSWARHQDEVRAAQRLRYDVFVGELSARLNPPAGTPAGHDADVFDAHCEHLLLRATAPDGSPGEVVGCYRLLSASSAQRVGGFYADTEFDLTRLRTERHRMAELGRACVHPSHRHGPAILMMWGAVLQRTQALGLDLLLGSASVPVRGGGAQAWALWNALVPEHLAPIQWQVRPRTPLHPAPVGARGYLRANAQLLGAPSWDPDFRCADFPLMLALKNLPVSYRRRFLDG